jgi:hypothetical protein
MRPGWLKHARAVGVRVGGRGVGVGGIGVIVGVSESVGTADGTVVAEDVADGENTGDVAIAVAILRVAKVAATTTVDVAASWLDEQAASPIPINRLVNKIDAAFTSLPIKRECTRNFKNTVNPYSDSNAPKFLNKV